MAHVLSSGLETDGGRLRALWFQVDEGNGRIRYHAVALLHLAEMPILERQDANIASKMFAALRGMHNAGVNFVFTTAGMFHPDHVGVVQYYGAIARHARRDQAITRAIHAARAVEANFCGGFIQSVLRLPALAWLEWYLDFVSRARNILTVLGHPDPREARRGLAKDGEIPDENPDDLALEQNEILFRGLARLREDFIFQVTSRHVPRRQLAATLVRLSQLVSTVASRQRGSLNVGFSLGIPIMASLGRAVSGGEGHSTAQATGHTRSHGHTWGQAHTAGEAHSKSVSYTVGGSESHSVSIGHTESQSDTRSWADTVAQSHTESQSRSHSVTQASGSSHTTSQSTAGTVSTNFASGVSGSQTTTQGTTQSRGQSLGVSQATTVSGSVTTNTKLSVGLPGVASVGGGVAATVGRAHTPGQHVTQINTQAASQSTAQSTGWNTSAGWGKATSHASGVANGTFRSQAVSDGFTQGSADSVSRSHTEGGAHTEGQADSVVVSHGWTRSWATTTGRTDTVSHADTTSEGWSTGEAESRSQASGASRMGGQSIVGGLSTGLMPSVSVGRSWQTEDHTAMRLTEILNGLQSLLNQAAADGGFMTTALLLTASESGRMAAESLIPQAFHGPGVPTPVLTLPGDEHLREHALAFLPAEDERDPTDPLDGALWTKHATLLTPEQVGAYTAPALLEEGTAMTVMAPIPRDMGFYTDMEGDAVLGHLISPETAQVTPAQVRLSPQRLMHTLFAADTGFGKSVAAVRMVYETTLRWKTRTVVLDFGAGWRQLLNAPGLAGHVDIRQLWPNAVRPLRWNPLQIGTNIDPETQWRAFADIFAGITLLGVRRQKQELLQALRVVYLRHGVLVDDPEVRADPTWGKVRDDREADLTHAAVGTPLGDLAYDARRALAVHRSQSCGLADLYAVVEDKLDNVPPRDVMLRGVLEGILQRLNPLVQGAASMLFAPGPDSVPIENLGRPWGVTIIEGGAFLDELGKAFLLGWAGWHLYTDMVARRVHHRNAADEPLLQIVYEEANKIFVKEPSSGESDGLSANQRAADMFRDARKYGVRLHVITQAPHLIPDDIISSCSNLIIGFLKNPKDKDIVLSALARSEKGFRDEEWRRFLDDLPIAWAIGRFPYTMQRAQMRPFLFRPLLLDAPEPDDAEIARKLGRLGG